MNSKIDLDYYFSMEVLMKVFHELKESKTDKYTEQVKIPIGYDGVKYQKFEKELLKNLQQIRQRVLNGKYIFYPLRELEIPKEKGGDPSKTRTLSIARIRDSIVQKQLYNALYNQGEDIFALPSVDNVSVAYRRNKSAHTAIRGIWQAYQEGYDYALDADIKKFFDTLDHSLLRSKIDGWIGIDTIAGNLLWRYVRTDYVPYDTYSHLNYGEQIKLFQTQKPSQRQHRTIGVPQGGVLSGMLANLYLHEFDKWLIENIGQNIDLKYFRYADDFVILTKSHSDTQEIHNLASEKLFKMQLSMYTINEEETKTKITHIPSQTLDFVGFRIAKNHIRVRPKNIERFKNRFKLSIKKVLGYGNKNSPLLKEHLIKYCINPITVGPPDICARCSLPLKRYNWISFFAPTITDVKQIQQLDRWIYETVSHFMYKEFGLRVSRKELIESGMVTLMQEYRRYKKYKFCKCDLEEATNTLI